MGDTAQKIYDLLVIGGGINGTGIARDAAGRGLSVVLCEKNDLASGTSSLSTKLIHGGLRYLEQGEFRLVRESLSEREILLRNAPHLIKPLRFVLPHQARLRPSWMIRSGLFLYDHLGKNQTLMKSEFVDLATSNFGEPLQSQFKKAYAFSDCWVDDARLVISNAIAARELGADIYNYTPVAKLKVKDGLWHANDSIRARVLVNASGPWIGDFSEKKPRLVKGSHIIVPRQYAGEHAYIIQNDDRRIIFVIPFEQNFELIGTTEVDFTGNPSGAKITAEEVAYLLRVYNKTFSHKINKHDIVWDYSGVRPLINANHKNPSKVSRDYRLSLKTDAGAPSLFIFGGKLTTYRRLAEEALEKLHTFFPNMGKPWTAHAPLPGGDIKNFADFVLDMEKQYPWVPAETCKRYARLYGTRIHALLKDKTPDSNLWQAEIDFLTTQEWAQNEDDILFRRTKLGLHRDII